MGNPIDIKVAEKTPVYTWIGVSIFLAILLAVFAAIGTFQHSHERYFVYVGDRFKATSGKNFIRQKGLRDVDLLLSFISSNLEPRWNRLSEELNSRLHSIHSQNAKSHKLTRKLKKTIVSAGFAPDLEQIQVEETADGYAFFANGTALAIEEVDGQRQYNRYNLLVGIRYTKNTTGNRYDISQVTVSYSQKGKEITQDDPYLYYVSHFAFPMD